MSGQNDRCQQLWLNIPAELRQRRQWCVCGPDYDRNTPKRPFNPNTRLPASPTSPDSWVTFDEAAGSGASQIGFVLTADDPFFVVDLDTYKSRFPENHQLLLGAVETYAERSLSGAGAHVIGKGTVGQGRNSRFHAIEIYDRARFVIMTGNRINDFGIIADQPFADYVMELLGPIAAAEALHYPASRPSGETDADLTARIERAENGPKFSALFTGNIHLQNGKDGGSHFRATPNALLYDSQSEADLALIEILCFFTPDDEQVARVFRASALGQREKAHRGDYVARSIRSARRLIASSSIPLLDFSELLARARSTGTGKGSLPTVAKRPGLILTRVSDVEAQEVRWIWPSRIAEGKVTVIAGAPGLGKSQLTSYLAAKVTTGGEWPNEDGVAPLGAVIMLSCEDDIADTIRPRLEAAGADITKVRVVEGVYSARGERRVFHVKNDMPQLELALERVKGVKLVVIDPITAYLDGADTHSTGDVRSALAPLQDLAMQRSVAVVAVSHLNKSGGHGRAVNAVTGSSAFVALSRATFLVEQDSDDPERRLLLPIKNNLAQSPGLAFRIRERILSKGIRGPFLQFEAGTVEISADEALSQAAGPVNRSSALEDAKSFLISQLRDGPVPAREMEERAMAEGYSRSTLRKAREGLAVSVRKMTGKNGGWEWALPLSGMQSNMP